MAILTLLMCYLVFFSIMGYYLFRSTFQGVSIMPSIKETLYQMIILLTTANFPDVMLPAYQVSWFYSLFFVSFLLFGLYFLLNLLLAKVFTNYKKTLESKADTRVT